MTVIFTQEKAMEARLAMAWVASHLEGSDPMMCGPNSYDLALDFSARLIEMDYLPDVSVDDSTFEFCFDWYTDKDNQAALEFQTEGTVLYCIITDGEPEKGISNFPKDIDPPLQKLLRPQIPEGVR